MSGAMPCWSRNRTTDRFWSIAAAVFLYFLHKNNLLFPNGEGEKIIAAHTLVAMVVMIASSKPEEKETMVRLVMNFLAL